jgi:long-chain acyl-CoA synthetase
MMICGGAPLSPDTAQFFAAMDLPLLQGYGLTEAGPAVTGTTIEDRRSDSVGRALPGSELAIGAKQELLVKSPGVMLGYWNKPDATKGAIDEDGWLHTGDAAEISGDRVYIRGRIKDILVLSTGENVNPAPIETALLSDPLIDQVCVLGDGKPYCTAVLVVDPAKLRKWLGEFQLSTDADHWPKTRKAFVDRVDKLLVDIPPFARIRDVVVETEPWSLESGLITPTLKAKRPRIVERYSQALKDIYG